MSISRETPVRADLFDMAGYAKADESAPAQPLSKTEFHARAAERMRQGQQLVISGFVVAVLGIVAYCVVCLSAAVNNDLGTALLESPRWLAGPLMGIIGLGTLLWLAGSFIYLIGGMDSDPDNPELYS